MTGCPPKPLVLKENWCALTWRSQADNTSVILINTKTKKAIAIDATEPDLHIMWDTIANDMCLSAVLMTHYHHDHTAGVKAIQAIEASQHQAITWYGAPPQSGYMPQSITTVKDQDILSIEGLKITCLHTPGHCPDAMSFVCEDLRIAFLGDTVFNLSSGRLIQGDADTLFRSFQKLKQLPDDLLYWGGHDYLDTNLAFAKDAFKKLPSELDRYTKQARASKQNNDVPYPINFRLEKGCNPFFALATDSSTFAHLRMLRNQF